MSDTEPRFWRSSLLAKQPRLVHAVTKGPWNMSMTAGPAVDTTQARRRHVCEILSVPFERLTVSRQVHGTRVAVLQPRPNRQGAFAGQEPIPGTDGLVTGQPNVPLMALSADCCLMVLYDPARPAVGVGHAGWRGTAAGLATALIRTMVDTFESRPEELLAAVSPCAGVCCYEVQDDVVSAFQENRHDASSIFERRNGSTFLNLAKANVLQLESSGVRRSRIDAADICTICSDEFFSYRRDGASAGHFALIAAIV